MMGAEARPAEPVLASALLGDGELDALVEGMCGVGLRKRDGGERLPIGVKSLDDALGGGLLGGRVVSVSVEGTGGSEVCRTSLVSSLLQYPDSTAAVIDTTGNFDVLRLYTLILARLQQSPDVLVSIRAATKSAPEATVEDVAAKVLDNIKIMRVFDFVGVREAIGEIRDDLEGRKPPKPQKEEGRDELAYKPKASTPEPRPLPKRTVVADSEDEEDDEEMLFDSSAPPPDPAPAPQQPSITSPEPVKPAHKVPEPEPQDKESPGKLKFILIDNLTQAINPLLRKDFVSANALASTFLYTLRHLTRTHNLHTILANPANSPRAQSPTRHAPIHPNQPAPPSEHQKQQPPPPSSIFAGSTVLPSLSGVLTRYVDTGVLVSQMPRGKMDARVFYHEQDGNDGGRAVKKLRGVEMVGVLEVVSDRFESRVGAWGTFVEDEKGMVDVS
ncbi:hypothetical protein CC86DRAFT_353369 [Ophiobolus disseminans]|uniref:DNA recombination and repair protein Rad51-like C-terminal domain-containing protein n=1 Tax=Ophiobolus disseminans TaxID=1469910 RepID=A0A6A6ZWD4_9PLEO|nr:hypothetical protein CC86DRAFT_353369 [Ophiobolus disseminans]